jgi:alcohol dehydrogenase class IV
MDFNMSVAAGAYAELAELVVPGLQVDGEEARASALIAAMRQLIDDLELPATLAAAGVSAADLEMLAKDAMEQQRLLVNNPRDVSYEDALGIYQAAYGEYS